MKVFKFGGASVKDPAGVKNLRNILALYPDDSILIVVSAMGKSTNKLERVVQYWFTGQQPDCIEQIEELRQDHETLMRGLDLDHTSISFLLKEVGLWFDQLRLLVAQQAGTNYNECYDQVVAFGELISTSIISHYLKLHGQNNQWIDAREYVVTNDTFRDARVQWQETQQAIDKLRVGDQLQSAMVVTQGFIGRVKNSQLTTTLGREGSDFTASIFAYCLGAKDLTIWKDVSGVLNADPKLFPFAEKIDELSYEEAVEMTYYGASVIHPKTIKPLQNKGIQLFVKSFLQPDAPGTVIKHLNLQHQSPACIIVKKNQRLISFAAKDFSFIAEESLAFIFGELYKLGIKTHLTQNSAISFYIVVDDDPFKVDPFLKAVGDSFEIKSEGGLSLWTIRNHSERLEKGLIQGKTLLLEQRNRQTVQYVLR